MLVHLLRKKSALIFFQEMEILESSVNAKAIVHMYLHLTNQRQHASSMSH